MWLPLAIIPQLIFGALVLLALLGVLTVYGVIKIPRALWARRQAALGQPPPPSPLPPLKGSGKAVPGPAGRGGARGAGWAEGEDLLRYPRRLSELEQRLAASHRDAQDQGRHLQERLGALQGKAGREDIANRYRHDLSLVEARARSMKRVLGLVWRTRAILEMRAHLAITARQRPDLAYLPEAEIPTDGLEQAAGDYDQAARQIRRFISQIQQRAAELPLAVPGAPADAEVDALVPEVETEKARVLQTYGELQERMDHLSDTLSYLSDRCRTRRVVEGAPAELDATDAQGEALMEEVSRALGSLNDLTALGEHHLADSTLDALAEDISTLERAGLEAQAEADAALEVARLLEQLEGGKAKA